MVCLAFALRLYYVLVIAPAPIGVGGDAGFYASAADWITRGHFLSRTIFHHRYVTAEHPPLYPLGLSLSSLVVGHSILAFRLVGCVVGSVAVGAIMVLGGRLGHARTGLVAGLLAAIYPPFITADALVMSEPLFVLLVTVAVAAGLRLRSAPNRRHAAQLGLIIGLAGLTRSEGLMLLPLMLSFALAHRTRKLPLIAVALCSTGAVLSPWLIRNAVVLHRPILATDSSTVLAGANCPETFYGHDIGWWSGTCLRRAQTQHQQQIVMPARRRLSATPATICTG